MFVVCFLCIFYSKRIGFLCFLTVVFQLTFSSMCFIHLHTNSPERYLSRVFLRYVFSVSVSKQRNRFIQSTVKHIVSLKFLFVFPCCLVIFWVLIVGGQTFKRIQTISCNKKQCRYGSRESRSLNLWFAKPTLYQLSYTPLGTRPTG